MSPTKRGSNPNDDDVLSESPVPPKRLRGGGGPKTNPYNTKMKTSSFAANSKSRPENPNNRGPPPDDDDDAMAPRQLDEDELFVDEIQEYSEETPGANAAMEASVFSDITEDIRKRWVRPANQVLDNSQELSIQWLDMDLLRNELNRDLHMVSEDELEPLFKDCETGAVPPLGPAYGIETLLDESIKSLANVYFEAGDHETLVHVSGDDFKILLAGVRHGYFSQDN